MTKLTTKRDNLVARLRTIDRTLPRRGDVVSPGRFPGVVSNFRIAGGGLSVKVGKMTGTEYHILGTWSATPIEDDG